MTVWYAGRNEISPCIPESYLYRVTNTMCRIGTILSPDDGHIVAPKRVQKSNKHTEKICAPVWFHLQQIIRGRTVNKTLKKN